MCSWYQHRWLPALAIAAAFALEVPAVPGQTPAQAAPQSPTQSSAQPPAQSTTKTPAASPSPVAAVAPDADTPEDAGDALMAQQHYQAAIEAYKKVPERSAELWNKMGIAYQLMSDTVHASRCYQASLKLDATNPRVMNNLGTIYDSEKQYGDAEHLYRKALKLDPKSGIICKNLGTNLLAQHKYKKGGEMYKTALELDPNVFQKNSAPRVQNPTSVEERGAMNFYMAKVCVQAGMNDTAIDYLRMALNEGFTNPKKIAADSEFAGLRAVPAFQQLLAEQRQQ